VQGRRTAAGSLLLVVMCSGTLLAGALPGSAAAPAFASGSTPEQRRIDARLRSSLSDLEDSSAQVQAAGAALRDVAARLPAAQREVAVARRELAAARSRADRAAEVARRAELAREQSQGRVDAVVARVETGRRTVAQLARQSYERGPVDVQPVFEATSARDFLQRTALIQQVFVGQNDGLRQLAADRLELARQTAELARLEAVAGAARDDAAAGERRAEQVTTRAQAAEGEVERLEAARQAALDSAQAARAADQEAYDQAQADSDALAARLREAARLRKAAAARAAAAQRAADAAAARAAARRAAAASRSTSSPRPTSPPPAPPTPHPTPPAAARSTGTGWTWPANGPITSGFGYRIHPIYGTRILHAGIDIGAAEGTPTYAAQDGVVVFAGVQSGYGNAIAVSHGIRGGHDVVSFYAHQSAILVSAGQHVGRGQTIGRVGSTGNVTGPHLHFEVRLDGTPVDPLGYVSPP